jgi:hypothetical protein
MTERWSWLYGSWTSNYLCNQCLSPLMLWVQTPLKQGLLDTTWSDKVCQWLATGRWFSSGTLVSSTNKTYRHDITEILLKVALNTINPNLILWQCNGNLIIMIKMPKKSYTNVFISQNSTCNIISMILLTQVHKMVKINKNSVKDEIKISSFCNN